MTIHESNRISTRNRNPKNGSTTQTTKHKQKTKPPTRTMETSQQKILQQKQRRIQQNTQPTTKMQTMRKNSHKRNRSNTIRKKHPQPKPMQNMRSTTNEKLQEKNRMNKNNLFLRQCIICQTIAQNEQQLINFKPNKRSKHGRENLCKKCFTTQYGTKTTGEPYYERK